uniref:Uncharacterized protein n=1 Tax=Romanomermis culicivorax TaxID=13658 RepID=A0A915HIA4_ROMCU
MIKSAHWTTTMETKNAVWQKVLIIQQTHSCPKESVKELTARESHRSRMPSNDQGKKPLSAMITKYVKNPALACIMPIIPIVHAVAGDGHDGALALTAFNDDQLLLRRRTGEDDFVVINQNFVQIGVGHLTQF